MGVEVNAAHIFRGDSADSEVAQIMDAKGTRASPPAHAFHRWLSTSCTQHSGGPANKVSE
jgi:hypothetical protein